MRRVWAIFGVGFIATLVAVALVGLLLVRGGLVFGALGMVVIAPAWLALVVWARDSAP